MISQQLVGFLSLEILNYWYRPWLISSLLMNEMRLSWYILVKNNLTLMTNKIRLRLLMMSLNYFRLSVIMSNGRCINDHNFCLGLRIRLNSKSLDACSPWGHHCSSWVDCSHPWGCWLVSLWCEWYGLIRVGPMGHWLDSHGHEIGMHIKLVGRL